MKHSNLYLGLVLPSGGWQSLIRVMLKIVVSLTNNPIGVMYARKMLKVQE
jgi:hypothetical protein